MDCFLLASQDSMFSDSFGSFDAHADSLILFEYFIEAFRSFRLLRVELFDAEVIETRLIIVRWKVIDCLPV
jgi:hypothetical protein